MWKIDDDLIRKNKFTLAFDRLLHTILSKHTDLSANKTIRRRDTVFYFKIHTGLVKIFHYYRERSHSKYRNTITTKRTNRRHQNPLDFRTWNNRKSQLYANE